MLSQAEIVSFLKKHKAQLQSIYGVESIGLFGSYATNSKFDDSDIDLLVEFQEPKYDYWVSLKLFLEKQFNKTVDITAKGPHLSNRFLSQVNRNIIYV